MMSRLILVPVVLLAAAVTSAGSQVTSITQRPTGAPPDTVYLSLEAAVTRAMRQSDEVRLARAQVDAADAAVGTARASVLPQLRVTGNYTKTLESARATAVGQIFNQPNTYTTNANLSQALFQGGREFAGLRSAGRTMEAAQQSEAEVRAQMSVTIQRAYLNVLVDQRLLEIQTTNLQLSANRLAQVQQKEKAGQAARYDVLRAQVERANLEPQVIQARSNVEVALLDLKRLLNLPMGQPVALTTVLDEDRVAAVAAAITADTSRAPVRPVLRAAELTARARHDAVSVARADYLPTISAFVNNGYSAFPVNGLPAFRGRVSNDFCPTGSAASRTCNNGGFFTDRSFGLQVSWPLFDGLRTKSAVDLAQANARVADLQLDQQRESVALEQARARAELDRATSAYQVQAQNVSQAQEAFDLASLRFSRGLGTQLDVSDAQLALLTARTNQARAVSDLYIAAADYARARGLPVPLPPTRQVGSAGTTLHSTSGVPSAK